jgi:hypothetical protein
MTVPEAAAGFVVRLWRGHSKGGCDIAAGAGAIFDHYLHIERMGKPFRDAAPDRIGNRARRVGDDHGNGPRWPIGVSVLRTGWHGEAA